MRSLSAIVTIAGAAFAAQTLSAQDQPEKEHEWLNQFVGQWEVVSEGNGMKGEAVMNSSMLGGLWLVNSSDHTIAGMDMKSIQMIGYDPDKEKYVGIWVDSMVNHLWHYEGTVDESGKKLTLEARGPSMTGDETIVNYRDAYEFTDDDTIVATASIQDEDGNWTVFMEGTAKRLKQD